jgi:putative DNA modification/repair radical SAM protein
MTLDEKVSILTGAAKYDVSCASSGSRRRNTPKGIGNAAACGVCHSWSNDGRCISLLKILLTNKCLYNCAYCVNRCSNTIPRASFTVEEIVNLTVSFYLRNYIEGLFLSSAVENSPNYTMERMVAVAETLRKARNFNGYIHLKAIPGASPELISRAGLYADRLSVNVELPSEQSLKTLAPQKSKHSIFTPMSSIGNAIIQNRDERTRFKHTPRFAPAGQSTQMIVSASPEPDLKILTLSEHLYRAFHLKRVYYSAYVAVNDDSRLPWAPAPNLQREHRLYQADWLLRHYGFTTGEILDSHSPQLPGDIDPKTAWALRNYDKFPVDIYCADYETLLRVPGIGVRSAKRICATRRVAPLRYEDLKRIGVVLKRARYFITCNGKFFERTSYSPGDIRLLLTQRSAIARNADTAYIQQDFFDTL